MLRLIGRKLILMAIILVLLNAVAYHYALVHPALFISPSSRPQEAQESHYLDYAQRLLQGDFGQVDQLSVQEIVAEPIKNSLVLIGTALLTTICFGLLFGFLALSWRTRRIGPLSLIFLSAGSSMPGFILGAVILSLMIYQMLFSGVRNSLLPISGYGLDRHLILPVIVLAMQPTFHLARVTANLLESELQKDYIVVAISKGLSWSQLLRRHAWPNMVSPILVTIGDSMRLMIGALVIVEAIFIWPGIGRIFLLAIGLRLDGRPAGLFFGQPELLAALVVMLGFLLLLADLVATVLAYRADPRLSRAPNNAALTSS
jgi:peptide/nickel transport system permease protein